MAPFATPLAVPAVQVVVETTVVKLATHLLTKTLVSVSLLAIRLSIVLSWHVKGGGSFDSIIPTPRIENLGDKRLEG